MIYLGTYLPKWYGSDRSASSAQNNTKDRNSSRVHETCKESGAYYKIKRIFVKYVWFDISWFRDSWEMGQTYCFVRYLLDRSYKNKKTYLPWSSTAYQNFEAAIPHTWNKNRCFKYQLVANFLRFSIHRIQIELLSANFSK